MASASSRPVAGPSAIPQRDGAVELDDRRGSGVGQGSSRRRGRRSRAQSVFTGSARASVTSGDRRLQRVGARRAEPSLHCARSSAFSPRPISRKSQRPRSWSGRVDGLAFGTRAARAGARPAAPSGRRGRGPRPRAEGCTARMRPSRSASRQQRRAHPVVTGGGRVALVEDQVDDLEDRGQPRGEVDVVGRDIERHRLCSRASASRARCAASIVGGRSRGTRARSPQWSNPSTMRSVSATRASPAEHGPAAGEDQGGAGRHRSGPRGRDLRGRAGRARGRGPLEHPAARACRATGRRDAAGRSRRAAGPPHEPGARVVRDARLRPALECLDQSLLRQVLGKPHVPHHPARSGRSGAPDSMRQTASIARCASRPVTPA